MIKNLIPKSEFSQNLLTLMTGTTLAQAIPIAISPILTRIYTPADLGVYALFIAITSILGSVANGRYELAIMLPDKDEDALNLLALGFIISSSLSLIILTLVILFNKTFAGYLGNDDIAFWLYFVPITIFLNGLWNVLNYYNNRTKNYKNLRDAHIIRSLVSAVVNLVVGFLKNGAAGLVSGEVFSRLISNYSLLKNTLKKRQVISAVTLKQMIFMARRYKNFPIISLPSSFISTLYPHLFSVSLSSLYNVSVLGHFYMAQRVLGIPITLLSASVGQVFFQSAVQEKVQTGQARVIFKSTVKKLLIITIPFFVVLYFIIEDLFAFVFSDDWRIAGTYSKLLIPVFAIRLVSSPVSMINTVFEKQIYGLIISIVLLVSYISVVFSSLYLGWDPEQTLSVLSAVLFTEYCIFLLHYYLLSGGDYISMFISKASK